MVPEWAPNIHPIIVHFPIALLVFAVATDLLSLTQRRHYWLQWAATGLYLAGALAGLAAFASGREAVESVLLPTAANSVVSEHADWALWTIWIFGVLALVRTTLVWRKQVLAVPVQLVFFCLGMAGMYFLYETGDHGAQLVYQYGVGVAAVDPSGRSPHDHRDHAGDKREESAANNTPSQSHENHVDGATHGEGEVSQEESDLSAMRKNIDSELHVTKKGDWHWAIGEYAASILSEKFTWLQGHGADVDPVVHRSDTGDISLSLHPNGKAIFLVHGEVMESMQVDLRAHIGGFSGAMAIVHHVQDVDDYYFLEVDGKEIRLGRMNHGQVEVFDTGTIETNKWVMLRLVSAGTHFRGYVDSKMVVHGHGKEPMPGRVGLRVEGSGQLLLDDFSVEQITE